MFMKNPTICKIIGYIVLFTGLSLLFWGTHYPTADDPFNGKNPPLIVLASLLIIGSMIWSIAKVRCPHCHMLLKLKFGSVAVCPYCGKDTSSYPYDGD